MKGWKTWASGIATILTGVVMVINALITDDAVINMQTVTEGMGVIAGGLAIIGIGHKLEKTSAKRDQST